MCLFASFARPVGLFDNWFNRFVAFLTGGEFCHSEFIVTWDTATAKLFFDDLDGHDRLKDKWLAHEEDGQIHICFYVLWGDTITYRLLKHDHNNPFYKYPDGHQFKAVEIHVDQDTEFRVANYLLKQVKKEYDYAGALTYWMPLRSARGEYPTYFCSQYMACALQHVDMLKSENPANITPNKLHKLLTSS
jgi:hypothetical protein